MVFLPKHKHLHKDLLEYYLNHTAQETMSYFCLTPSEFKSCLTAAYQRKEYAHIRKDNRKNHKRYWTVGELVKMIKMAGFLPRYIIAEELDRGNERVIKEKMNKLGISSRNLNGVNLSQAKKITGIDGSMAITGFAGPISSKGQTCYKIVLWTDIQDMIYHGKIPAIGVQEKMIEIMAMFQRWIWDCTDQDIKKNILKMLDNYYIQ